MGSGTGRPSFPTVEGLIEQQGNPMYDNGKKKREEAEAAAAAEEARRREAMEAPLRAEKQRQADQAAIDEGAKKQQAARSKQRSMALASQGRKGTILTSPLGAMGDSGQVQRKTLLGQ